MSTKADVSGERFPLTLLLGKRFITISENGNSRGVGRTFSWLENYRRLTIDYEFLTETAEAMVSIAFIQIALNRFF